MSRTASNTTELALDAAADLILANPPEPPPTPSINQLCKAIGIGASTFYRHFENAGEFRQAMAVFSILASYQPGREAVLTELEIKTADRDPSERTTTSETERAALIGLMSQTFQDTGVRRDALEAAYLPWLHNPNIAAALRQSFETASTDYGDMANAFILWAGQKAIASATPDDVMRRVLSVILACDLVPTELTWSTKAKETVPAVVYIHVNLVEAMSEPY